MRFRGNYYDDIWDLLTSQCRSFGYRFKNLYKPITRKLKWWKYLATGKC